MTAVAKVKRKREPNLAREIAAIIKAGQCPHLVRRPDGTLVLTGLPPEKVATPDSAGEDLDARMDAALGTADGDVG